MAGANQARCGANLALAIVIVFCAIFALKLGLFSQTYGFERVHSESWLPGACGSPQGQDAFAKGGTILMYAQPKKSSSAAASFDGSGRAETASVRVIGGNVNATRLVINGQTVCSGCQNGKDYPVNAVRGKLELVVDTAPYQPEPKNGSGGSFFRPAFFDGTDTALLAPEVWITVKGGWNANENAWMPSSFYGTDAPYHIRRIPILANHLANLQWPWSFYSFLSSVPPAAIYMAGGAGAEYAYKQFAIMLFFSPVAVFYLFSRKLPLQRNAAFLFASLCYLFLPNTGLLVGGGADIIAYGMVPHTLATILSLVFMYFAYEYAIEGQNRSFLPAVAVFFLSAISNPRILFALPFAFLALAGIAVVARKLGRTALLAVACAAAIAWVLAPAMGANTVTGGSQVGGAKIGQGGQDALVGFFQIGHVLLPVLFAIGVARAYRGKWLFPFFIAASATAAYIFTANPDVNRAMPFIDGIRLLPSFYLPAFFIAGIGMAAVYAWALGGAGPARKRAGWDEVTFAGSVMLAILIPLAVIFGITAYASIEQYSNGMIPLRYAAEYSGFEKAYRIVGAEKAAMCGRGAVSQHIVYGPVAEQAIAIGCGAPDGIEAAMRNASARYVLFGNLENPDQRNRTLEDSTPYERLAADPRFYEVETGGSIPVFALRNASGSGVAAGEGATLQRSEVEFDRARFEGVCNGGNCSVSFISPMLPASTPLYAGEYKVSYDSSKKTWEVDGIRQGAFAVDVAPKPPFFALPLAIACILLVAACAWASGSGFFSGAPESKRRKP